MRHPMHPTTMVAEAYPVELIDAALEDENGDLPSIMRIVKGSTLIEGGEDE